MHWIIGTAGHIDHGKTSLIKALTGVDTDRLKEEKERGISIDLGFASLELPDGTRAGVVDVPGHERFVRNMLAGAHGIDLVLFTVAADDGVMPQTEEHLDIVHLLGVKRAVFVLTKVDLVSADRAEDVAEEIRTLVAGTALEGAPIVPCAAPAGVGIDEVRTAIAAALNRGAKAPPAGRFRLPVDRAFSSIGHGLIVTGTAISGEIRAGDRVRLLPSGELLRVRSVEVHGAQVDVGCWGQRIALNLTSSHSPSIARGDVIVDEGTTLTCDRFDALVEARPSATRGLKDHQRVRVHLGTAERMGKIVPLGSRQRPGADSIAGGEHGYAQLVLAEPVVALRGDRFILRDETAQRTLGGGVVLLPATEKRKRTDPAVLANFEALERGDDAELFPAVVNGSGAFSVSLTWLAQRLNDRDDEVRRRANTTAALHAFDLESEVQYTTPGLRDVAIAGLLDAVTRWHTANPLSPGLDVEEARTSLPLTPAPRVFRALVDEIEGERRLVREGSSLRLPSHRIAVTGADQVAVDRVMNALSSNPLSPPDVKQLLEMLGLDRSKLLALLKAMEKSRQVIAVATDLYFAAPVVERLRQELLQDLQGGKTLTTADFRDRYKTSRKYAIPLLEYFDRVGVTIRMGDVRRLREAARKA